MTEEMIMMMMSVLLVVSRRARARTFCVCSPFCGVELFFLFPWWS